MAFQGSSPPTVAGRVMLVNAGKRGRSLLVADGTTNDSCIAELSSGVLLVKEAALGPRRPHVTTPFAFSLAAAIVLQRWCDQLQAVNGLVRLLRAMIWSVALTSLSRL